MSMSDVLNRGLKMLEVNSGGNTFIYQNWVIACTANTLMRGATQAIGGEEEEIQLTLVVRKDAYRWQLTSDNSVEPTGDSTDPKFSGDDDLLPPQTGKIIIYKQRQFRILSVDEESTDTAWRIHLGSINR